MLEKIEYKFPKDAKGVELFNLFKTLFKNVVYAKITDNQIEMLSNNNLKPKTIFTLDDKIQKIEFNIGNKKYSNLLDKKPIREDTSNIQILLMEDVITKLQGHIKRIDHTAVNLPTELYSNEEWNDLLTYLSSVSNIYSYPTGEPWPFLLPSSIEEKNNEITNFNLIREPRFELVYDDYTNVPTIHIDMETDLSKKEIEALFPGNQGIYFKENPYKAIYINYNKTIDIRLDIRFKRPYSDFESGEWLVTSGKRL